MFIFNVMKRYWRKFCRRKNSGAGNVNLWDRMPVEGYGGHELPVGGSWCFTQHCTPLVNMLQ